MTSTADSTTSTDYLLEEISRHGYVIIDDFLPDSVIKALNQKAKSLQNAGSLKQASIGKADTNQILSRIRGDSILWLDERSDDEAQICYLSRMRELQQSLNHYFFLGLVEFESHFAIYPPAAAYQKHLDQFRGQQERQVSAVLYLNTEWLPGDGGELRLYLDETAEQSYLDIAPKAGRMVLFLSGRFLHEVLPARRERISLTGWFRTRANHLL
jgi:SM-20-related protein